MPIYEYRCEKGHQFEVIQSMSADPVTACEECGAPVERVFHPIAVHFKGSGFYTTDYKDNSKAGKDSTGAATSERFGLGDKKSDSSDTKNRADSDSKSDSKAEQSAPATRPKASSSSD